MQFLTLIEHFDTGGCKRFDILWWIQKKIECLMMLGGKSSEKSTFTYV